MASKSGSSTAWSHDFEEVLKRELDKIRPLTPPEDKTDPTATARAHRAQLVGLAFSGGGIRSATFNLGVLQGLARMKLLSMFDYLSTVSGGGYIGSWLLAWIKRAENAKDVYAGLHPEWGQQPGRSEPREIHFLRQYSNYLTPKLGWLGADTWTVVAIYVRNLILNLIILASAGTVVLLGPRWLIKIFDLLWRNSAGREWIWAVSATLCLIVAVVAIIYATFYFGRSAAEQRAKGAEKALEKDKNVWKDVSQKNPVDPLSQTGGIAWHKINFFDNFCLRLEFKILKPGGEADIFLWKSSKEKQATAKDDSEHIYLADPALVGQEKNKQNGWLNGRGPVRSPEFKPDEWNTIEISCVKQRCVVRINNETVNAGRMKQWAEFLPNTGSSQDGAIGLASKNVTFQNIEIDPIETRFSRGGTPLFVKLCIVVPLFLAAFLATFVFGYESSPARPWKFSWLDGLPHWVQSARDLRPWRWWFCGLVASVGSALLVFLVRLGLLLWHRTKWIDQAKQIILETSSIAVAAGVGGICAWALSFVFDGRTPWEVQTWAVPLLILAFLVTIVLYIGLRGRQLHDERREWWSRLTALLLSAGLAWIAIFGVALYSPLIFGMRNLAWRWATGVISVGWIVSTVSGLLAARSSATGSEKSNRMVDLIAKVAPYIFVAGFFIFLSTATDRIVMAISGVHPPTLGHAGVHGLIEQHWGTISRSTQLSSLLWATLIPLVVALWLSRALDINQFSMHMLYRNRLGRCYLGASNRFRQAQPFTGFAVDDDFKLSELSEKLSFAPRSRAAPYPIINAALNLVGGQELAWQQRKAASFVFSPLYCGYDFPELPPGYCPTPEFAGTPSPVTMATAMAISGAAVSPNMGYHTSPAPAFLMTVFNIRLGWWLGNPRRKTWQRSGPLNVLMSLMRELFGLTQEKGSYIYLSDGGHFENLGIYELVRRRCRFIVACDAEEDHAFGFSGLGNAIEKCRADFGIDIQIDVEPIRHRSEKGHSEWHCAIGRIHYSEVDENAQDGVLVYLKSSLTGDEPTDVLRYAGENPEFPHQSTADQWFDESQFESYRALGCHVVERVFGAVDALEKLGNIRKEDLFVALAQAWFPPTSTTTDCFIKHTRACVAIYDQLRTDRNLASLNAQIFPEWEQLFEKSEGKLAQRIRQFFSSSSEKTLSARLPQNATELQACFYLCNSVIQLMEDAYVDLNLEKEFAHPDNRGWMNFFKHWSWSPMFRVTWTISASIYGARFQSFCERHLNLTIGRIDVESEPPPEKGSAPAKLEIDRVTKLITDTLLDWLLKKPFSPQVVATAINEAKEKVPDWQTKLKEPRNERPLDSDIQAVRSAIEKGLARDLAAPANEKQTDEEWMGAATMLLLIKWGASEQATDEQASKIARLITFRATKILERLSGTFIAELNRTERQLIELFFVYHPTLLPGSRLFRFQLVPGYHATGSGSEVVEDLKFMFGFAIVAKIDDGPKIVYFRVRDHLRTIGLGRRALAKLVDDLAEERERLIAAHPELAGKETELGIALHPMHPNAHEVPTDDDREEFERLFDSVIAAREQKPGAGTRSQAKA